MVIKLPSPCKRENIYGVDVAVIGITGDALTVATRVGVTVADTIVRGVKDAVTIGVLLVVAAGVDVWAAG